MTRDRGELPPNRASWLGYGEVDTVIGKLIDVLSDWISEDYETRRLQVLFNVSATAKKVACC
jgi:hypothetical protein